MTTPLSRRALLKRTAFTGAAAFLAPSVLASLTGCGVDPEEGQLGARADALGAGRDPSIIKSFGGMVIPATGCYWGADDTTRGFTSSNGIETQLKRRMAIRNRHYNWLAACPSAASAADAGLTSPKVIPMVSLEGAGPFPVKTAGWQGGGDLKTTSFGKGMDRIANGEFDGYFGQVARDLKALGTPVIFRLWMEMNGDHNPYYAAWQGGVGTGGEASFAAAYRHVRSVFRTERASLDAGGNCIFVFCPQQPTTQGTWEAYWPGDSEVDFMGLDLYRHTFAMGAQNAPTDMNTYGWAVSKKKPFIICEAGFSQGVKVTTPSGSFDKDGSVTGHSLIAATAAALKQNPQCVAYVTWNNLGPIGNDLVDTSALSESQYRAWVNDPYYGLVHS